MKIKTAQQQITKIKEIAQKQVYIKRAQLKEKMSTMRKQAERKQNSIIQQLKEVKMSMAEDMTKVYKDGDESRCKGKDEKDKIERYCANNFAEDYLKFDECKDPENFCYVCCENEFGDMHKDKRQLCYDNLCNKKKEGTKEDSNDGWLWVGDVNKLEKAM